MAESRLANRLCQLRTEKRIQQKILAQAIGINAPRYSRIEKGERRPRPEQLDILADVFGVDQKELQSLLVATNSLIRQPMCQRILPNKL